MSEENIGESVSASRAADATKDIVENVVVSRRKRPRGPRPSHTLRGLLEKTTPLTLQQKLELEELQRKRARMLATGVRNSRQVSS
jgi:hypothetical protein